MDLDNRRFASVTVVGVGLLGLLLLARGAWASDSVQADSSQEVAMSDSAGPEITTSSTSVSGVQGTKSKPFSILGYWSAQSNLYHTNDPNYSAESDVTVLASYKISEDYNLLGVFGFKQELTQQNRLLGTDDELGIGHSAFQLNPYVKFTPAVMMTIPVSDESRNQDTLYTGVSPTAEFDLDGSGIGLKFLSYTYFGKFSRNFYQYSIASTGDTNIEYALKHTNWITLQFTKSLSYLQTIILSQGWNYVGHEVNKFEFDEELDYALGKNLSIGGGLSNNGNVLAANQQNSNVDIYNPDSATVYGQLIFRY